MVSLTTCNTMSVNCSFLLKQSEDEHGRPARKRGPVRFNEDVQSDVSQARGFGVVLFRLVW